MFINIVTKEEKNVKFDLRHIIINYTVDDFYSLLPDPATHCFLIILLFDALPSSPSPCIHPPSLNLIVPSFYNTFYRPCTGNLSHTLVLINLLTSHLAFTIYSQQTTTTTTSSSSLSKLYQNPPHLTIPLPPSLPMQHSPLRTLSLSLYRVSNSFSQQCVLLHFFSLLASYTLPGIQTSTRQAGRQAGCHCVVQEIATPLRVFF